MMTDPKGGIANIKKKKPVPNYENFCRSDLKECYPPFQSQDENVKKLVMTKVFDYNNKPGKLSL